MNILKWLFLIGGAVAAHLKNIELNQTNFVSLIGPITQTSVDFAIHQLNSPEVQDLMHKEKKIMIYINSPGGSVSSGNHFVQYMHSLQNRNISVECIGQNFMSMAFHIFQNCNHRMILENSIGMQHQMSFGIHGNLENMNRYFKMTRTLNRLMNEVEMKKIGVSQRYYLEKVLNDWWIYGTENIINNIADEIVLIYCSPQIHDRVIKRKEYFNGSLFYILYSHCPLYKTIDVSIKKFDEFYSPDKFIDNVKKIQELC